ncbi:hypothetical protein [Parabacteroides distasonis]|nr:hypothetical protein [Parabacteroides distasonis]
MARLSLGCMWDKDYNEGIVILIRKTLLAIAGLANGVSRLRRP